MGVCISSYMERQNRKELVDFPAYREFAAYGDQNSIAEGKQESNAVVYRAAKTDEALFRRRGKEWYSEGSCMKVVEQFCKERGKKVALAYRNIVNVEKSKQKDDNGREKVFNTYVFDTRRQTISYELFWKNIISFGKGLCEIGLKKGDVLSIYEETCWQWLNTLYGCWTQGVVVATVYANLGEDALKYALAETDSRAIVCNGGKVANVIKLYSTIGHSNVKIIYIGELPSNVSAGDFELIRWDDVVLAGQKSQAESCIPDGSMADELALIMYTSGTTGNPKGVMHTHGSLYAGVCALGDRVEEMIGTMKDQEWYCSYLPLAHIMEFVVLSILMKRGVIIGFGSPRTLTDQYAKPHGDLAEYRPLLLVAVPRVFDTMKQAVEAKLPKPGTLARKVFDNAYKARLQALKDGKDTPYYNKKVFSKPRSFMGGRVYAMLSGGGPLSASTQEFINVVFGMVIQGWGLTETVCVGAIQRVGNLQYGSVGQLLQSEEAKLVDSEDFKHTDKPHARGEICLRGPFLFKGYYKQPELTKEALDAEGWFHTGDVAAIKEDNAISLVGRSKALAKNANGEYIALETLESIYGTNDVVVPNCVCVLVSSERSYIALIGLTNEKLVEKFMKKHNISGKFPDVLKDADFNKQILSSLQATARQAGRASFEVVQSVRLLDDEWTPENGVLTAAMKLKRSAIEKRYEKLIEELFSKK